MRSKVSTCLSTTTALTGVLPVKQCFLILIFAYSKKNTESKIDGRGATQSNGFEGDGGDDREREIWTDTI